jgi:hypothetical protein
MDRSTKYHRFAADAFGAAQHISDPHLKAAMLEMARAWSVLSDHAEQSSELGLTGGPPVADDHIQ